MTDRTEALLLKLTLFVAAGVDRLRHGPGADDPDADRGDVPGWVMITLMTAIVVIALLAVFRTQVVDAVRAAFDSIR